LSPIMIGVIGIIVVIIFLLNNMPIAFGLAITGTLGIIILNGFQIGIFSLGTYPYGFLTSWLLVAVPLFILMGNLASTAGAAEKAYATANKWLNRLPGGLAMASIAACACIAATSGSSLATAGVVGSIAIPEMRKYGYDRRFAAGTVSCGGLLGILIPPSIPLVLYGFLAQESIGKLLLAGIIPGILTALIYCLGISMMVKVSWRDRFKSLPSIWGVAILFLTIVVGIYSGFFTPTEAAAVGSFVGLLMCFATRKKIPTILKTFFITGSTTGMILTICLGACLFTQFLHASGVPGWVSESVTSLPISKFWILIIILAIYIPLGMFLDTISILLITVPIFEPVIVRLGYDPIWFGILVVKLIEIGLITPPVGLNVYVIKGVAPDIPLNDIFLGTLPFLAMEFITLTLLVAFPEISLLIPSMMEGG